MMELTIPIRSIILARNFWSRNWCPCLRKSPVESSMSDPNKRIDSLKWAWTDFLELIFKRAFSNVWKSTCNRKFSIQRTPWLLLKSLRQEIVMLLSILVSYFFHIKDWFIFSFSRADSNEYLLKNFPAGSTSLDYCWFYLLQVSCRRGPVCNLLVRVLKIVVFTGIIVLSRLNSRAFRAKWSASVAKSITWSPIS